MSLDNFLFKVGVVLIFYGYSLSAMNSYPIEDVKDTIQSMYHTHKIYSEIAEVDFYLYSTKEMLAEERLNPRETILPIADSAEFMILLGSIKGNTQASLLLVSPCLYAMIKSEKNIALHKNNKLKKRVNITDFITFHLLNILAQRKLKTYQADSEDKKNCFKKPRKLPLINCLLLNFYHFKLVLRSLLSCLKLDLEIYRFLR